jgi:predicted dienelactone hydrolase
MPRSTFRFHPLPRRFWRRSVRLAGGCLAGLLIAMPAFGAEQVYLSLGIFERSIAVNDLERYAQDGVISRDLRPYMRQLTPKEREQVRSLLTTRADVTTVAVAQFLYTDQGEALLERLSRIIRTRSPEAAPRAIRAAMILATASDDGLTPINLMRQFPLRELRIDVEAALSLVNEVETLINQTTQAIQVIQSQASYEARREGEITVSTQSPPHEAGPYAHQIVPLQLRDRDRQRTFDVDVYLPIDAPPAPVIIISHGLGSDRTTYRYLADHLSSHGFAVAVLEHPGSNAEQIQALVQGRVREVTPPQEFIDRPQDVSFLLDELERFNRNHPQLRDRLRLDQTGIIGQSLGGYTALTLVGGALHGHQLVQTCYNDSWINLSLLLQCQALSLPSTDLYQSLQDDRIAAALTINPIGSGLIGQPGFNQIEKPVMVMTGNADTIAPALPEQIRPFTWLGSLNKYLVLMQGATHFSTLGSSANGSEALLLPSTVVGPDPAIAHRYVNAMSVAFFQTYVVDDPSYRTFLRATYADYLSNQALPLSLVRSLDPIQLSRAIALP